MSEWKEYKLGEVTEVTSAKRIFYSEYMPTGVPFYRSKEIIDLYNNREVTTELFISEERFNEIEKKYGAPQVNDILITSVGSLGIPYIVKENDRFYFKDGNLTWIKSIDTNRLLPQYLKNWIISSIGKQKLDEITIGSTQPALTISGLKSMSLKLPPIEEQKRIAGVLSSLDDKIDLLNRENATLEALAETLFRHYFIENPDPTWKEGKIADLVDFNPSRKLTKNEDSPYIEMANIETQGYAPSSWRMRPFASGTKFINGDAIMARISPCLENGKAAYIDFLEDGQVGWGSTEFLVMRSKMGLHPFFAYIMTRYDDFRDHAVSSLVGSSGRQRVDLDNLLKYSIFIPDEKAITRFNQEMEMIVSKMRNNQLQMRTLAFQRDIILPRLMYGELKVTAQ